MVSQSRYGKREMADEATARSHRCEIIRYVLAPTPHLIPPLPLAWLRRILFVDGDAMIYYKQREAIKQHRIDVAKLVLETICITEDSETIFQANGTYLLKSGCTLPDQFIVAGSCFIITGFYKPSLTIKIVETFHPLNLNTFVSGQTAHVDIDTCALIIA